MAYPLFHELGPAQAPMVLSQADFARAFPSEGDYVEFKQGIPESKVAEAVAAFSNANGGVVLLGVNDTGRVTGIGSDGETQARIHRAVAAVRDPGRYELHVLQVEDRHVLALAVHRRREGFAQMHDGRLLIRRGAMNSALMGNELAVFVSGRALTRFEQTPVNTLVGAADPNLVTKLIETFGWGSEGTLARLFEGGLIDTPTERSPLTVAGALYLLPRPADVLGKAYIEIFRYRNPGEEYDSRIEFSGPADQQVGDATEHIMKELGSDIVILGLYRHELPRIPQAVLREALANAVAHRSYESARQSIRVEIHRDRVTIKSPGGLPEPVTIANMRQQNASRNATVIRILRAMRLAEDAGRGVDVMQDEMAAAMLNQPIFDTDGHHVEVVLPLGSAVSPPERAWLAEIERRGSIRPDDRLLLVHAARGELLTNTVARELLGVDSTHARASLGRLKAMGYVQQHGERGGATYSLAHELAPPPGLGLAQDDLRSLVIGLAKSAPITNESVRERTGLDRAAALRLLSELTNDGLLVRHGSRRGTFYTLAEK